MAGQLHETFVRVVSAGSDWGTHAQTALESGHDQAVLSVALPRACATQRRGEGFSPLDPAAQDAVEKIISISAD